MKIYYAHSIRGSHSDGEWTPLDVINYLVTLGHEVLSEEIRITLEKEIFTVKEIYCRDTQMIRDCDIVIANVTNPSLGVGYEIAYAESLDKKITCFYQSDISNHISAMITGNTRFETIACQKLEELGDAMGLYA